MLPKTATLTCPDPEAESEFPAQNLEGFLHIGELKELREPGNPTHLTSKYTMALHSCPDTESMCCGWRWWCHFRRLL